VDPSQDRDRSADFDPRSYANRVTAIYRENYAARYGRLYLEPWPRKHELNLHNLAQILDALPIAEPSWLDLACGQAWHFARFVGRARMYGLDLSPAQLARARINAPTAAFVRADMVDAPFLHRSFDLATIFWGAYCYLDSAERIEALLHNAMCCLRPGGTLYIEVLLPRDLASFNESHFSRTNGFTVTPRTTDYEQWFYDDFGGRHWMMSPPLQFFLDIVAPEFEQIEAKHDGGFMIHLIAGKLGNRGPRHIATGIAPLR